MNLTTTLNRDYSFGQVLNTLQQAECPAPDSRGFFSPIVFNSRVVGNDTILVKAGKVASRLVAVFKYLAASLNKRRILNKSTRRPIMAAQSKSAPARRKTKSVSQSKPIQLTREMISAQGWNAYHEFVGNLTKVEIRVVGHLRPMTFPSPQAVINEARRLLGESAAKCKVIQFPVIKKHQAAEVQ